MEIMIANDKSLKDDEKYFGFEMFPAKEPLLDHMPDHGSFDLVPDEPNARVPPDKFTSKDIQEPKPLGTLLYSMWTLLFFNYLFIYCFYWM